jgi:hypothetical protein
MAVIALPLGPPYGKVPVNTDLICAAIPDPAQPAKASDLLIDAAGGRSIAALLDIRQVGQLLGAAFVQFTMAGGRSPCFVSRTAWVSIVPHPQVAGVAQINFANRYLAVVGSVGEVRAKLEGPSAVPTAAITARGRRRRASKGSRAER